MPAGCDFTCRNKECECTDTGFVISDFWPLGRIELVIENPQVKKMNEFRNVLLSKKEEGVKYVCIPYPNNTSIPTKGYRIQYWCSKCNCIWKHDVMAEDNQTFNDAVKDAKLMDSCPKCKGFLLEFSDVIESGIDCPHCNKALQMDRWFSNEIE